MLNRAAIDHVIKTKHSICTSPAGAWLRKQLEGATNDRPRVVYHSIVWQYFCEQQKNEFTDIMTTIGEKASSGSPLVWLRLEPAELEPHAELRMTTWPDHCEFILAESGFHGEWVRWQGIQ